MTTALAPLRLQKARIIAVPLARPVRNSLGRQGVENGKVLTYYQFQLNQKKPQAGQGGNKERRWMPEGGISTWAQNKAADMWASFGKAEEGWKLRVYNTGERLMNRLDFEELALKSIDPALGPTFAHPTTKAKDLEKNELMKIPLLYPPSMTTSTDALSQLRRYAEHRTPMHKRGFYTWMAVIPFTAPLKLIPIIPNLPFFFAAWRSWSHYKAYKSSEYLQLLLNRDLIAPEASEILDAVYKQHPQSPFFPSESSSLGSKSTSGEDYELLLWKDAVAPLVDRLKLDPKAGEDLYRALEQAKLRLETGKLGP